VSEFKEVAFVNKGPPDIRVTERIVGVGAWSNALQCDRVKWEKEPPPDVRNYKLFLVNLFPQSQHISHIRALNPDAMIVAMPDPHLERSLRDGNLTMLEEMQKADYVGGRTPYDCEVYGYLLNKPAVWMPSPIDVDALKPLRDTPKEDFILTVDHRAEPNLTAQNVAAVAAVQRELGLKVIYCKPMGNTLELAKLAGLEADFQTKVPFTEFVHLIARAKFGIDMYAAHAQHRHGQAHAAIGTPLITSGWGNYTAPFSSDFDGPFDIGGVLDVAHGWCTYDYLYENAQEYGYEAIERLYSFEAAQHRIKELLSGKVSDVRNRSQSRRAYGLRFTA
jgi:hypothetical protein